MPRRPVARKGSPLTRERIIRASLELVDEHGLDALTMRRLGAELGVEAMSLYSHFRNKEELLDGVQEAVLDELEVAPRRGGWRAQLTRAAHGYRNALGAHPAVMPLFASRQLFTRAAMRHIEPMMESLAEAGLAGLECIYAVDLLTTFVVGHALGQWGDPRRAPGETFLAGHLAGLAQLPPAQFPMLADLLPRAAEFDFDDSFEFGLRCVLDGLELRISRHR